MLNADLIREAMRLHQESIDEGSDEKLQQAKEIFNTLLNDNPGHPQAIFSLATCYLQEGLNGLAVNLYQQALKYNPAAPEIWNNIGSAYKAEQRDNEARKYFLSACKLREHPDYFNNLGTLHVNTGEPEKGMPYLHDALKLDPAHAKATWNLSLLELETGDWSEGFRHYLAGLDSGDRQVKPYQTVDNATGESVNIPFWKGDTGKNVVVYGEQGLGDEIMFASAMPDLVKDCNTIIFDTHPRLIEIFRRSFAKYDNIIAYYPDRKKRETHWEYPHAIDYVVPIGNLFYHYRSEGQFPRQTYLSPDPEKTQMYREYFESLGDGPYVGVSWMGGSKRTHMNVRNAKLGHLTPLMEQPGTFISLQYTDVRDKVGRYNAQHDKKLHHDQPILQAFDYDETMAYVAALDVVVCINTTVAHLCGAMGKDCIVMTPYQRAWRYSRYPNETMFQYGDHVTLVNKDRDESWGSFVPRVVERYNRWRRSR